MRIQYFIYISRERVDELFESAFDHIIDGVQHSESRADKEDGNASLSFLAGLFKTGISFGRADSEGTKTDARKTAVSRLKDVVEVIRAKQNVMLLSDAIQDDNLTPADWYIFDGELTGKDWSGGSLQVELSGAVEDWELRLSCRAPDFSGLYKEKDNYIPTSTNYYLFEGEVALAMSGLIRIAHVSSEARILRGSPLFLALNTTPEGSVNGDVAF